MFKSHKSQKNGTVSSYSESVNNVLEAHTTDEVIAETEADTMRSTQRWYWLPAKYGEALWWNKALQCDRVYFEYVLKDTFIDGLPESTRHSIHSYWGSKMSTTVYGLARHTTSLEKLRRGWHNKDALRHNNKT